MSRLRHGLWLLALVAVTTAGCAQSPLVLKGQVEQAHQERLALTRQNEQLQSRAGALDYDNQELNALLSQTKQQNQVLQDQVAAVRDQLDSVTTQLAQVRQEKAATEKQVRVLTASMQRRGGVSIRPNSSLNQTLPTIHLAGANVRRDGDVVRLTLPGSNLFTSGAQLRPGADGLITQAATQLAQNYPGYRIGVEGHTDSDPVRTAQWRNNHELSISRATVVYNVLINQAGISPGTLFVVGHGPNRPIASNATPEGKRQNRRVELVVYPQKAP